MCVLVCLLAFHWHLNLCQSLRDNHKPTVAATDYRLARDTAEHALPSMTLVAPLMTLALVPGRMMALKALP